MLGEGLDSEDPPEQGLSTLFASTSDPVDDKDGLVNSLMGGMDELDLQRNDNEPAEPVGFPGGEISTGAGLDADEDDDLQEEALTPKVLADDNPLSGNAPETSDTSTTNTAATAGGPSYDDLIAPPPSYAESMMPPPSYADSVMLPSTSGEIEQIDGMHPEDGEISPDPEMTRSRCFSNAKGVLDVTVTDPVKHDDETSTLSVVGKKYVDYLVTTTTSLPGFSRPKFSVRRRFNDFVLLSDCLADSHRGYFIPQRPEKALMEGGQGLLANDKEFVEQRRAALEKYLERLVSHPVLLHSAELRAFLEFEGRFPTAPALKEARDGSIITSAARLPKQLFGNEPAVPNTAEVTQPTKASRDFMRVFKELKQSLTEKTSQVSQHTDDEFLKKDVVAQLGDLEKQLTASSHRAEDMVMKSQKLGDVLGELGMVFIKLANFEDTEGTRRGQYSEDGASLADMASDLARIGRACVRLNRLARAASGQMVTQLAPLHEYLAMHSGVKKALQHRTDALLTAQTLESEVFAKKNRIQKLEQQSAKVFGGDKARQKKVEELKNEVEAAEASHTAAMQEYERIKGRNKDEWDRYSAERSSDLSSMLCGTARVQAAYADRSFAIWMAVAEEFGATADDL